MAKSKEKIDPSVIIAQIREGDNVGIKVFLRGGGDPNLRNNMGWTLLHLACLEGQAEISETLLDAGAMVNCCTTDMCTPLHLATAKGNKKTVEVLANKGAYINAQDKTGNTPLHEAAKGFHTAIVGFLLEKKADKARTNKKNQTFLDMVGKQMMPAVESGDSEVLVQWLDWGLTPNTYGNLNWSLLHHASARGQINIASILLERGADVNALDSNRSTPLHVASFHGRKRIVELLVGRGANVNTQDQRGNTALHSAIFGGHPEIINLLLQKGCDTTIANKEGQILTHLVNEFLTDAVEKNQIAHVITLLKGNANPDTKTSSGFPVLCCASFKGNVLVVDALLEAGADANICTEDNLKTPLHYAAALGNLFVLKSLLDKGASVATKDKSGMTPLHEVAREGAEDVVTVLIGRGAPVNAQDVEGNTPLHIAARWGQSGVVELLLEKSASEDIRNKNGMLYSDLALMRAVRTQDTGQVVSGLAWGGNPNTQDSKGWSLLHHAVYKSAKEVCSVLLESGADVNITDKHGRTPLFLASYRGDHQIMEVLLKAGADANIQDIDGRTPLHWAADEGSIDTVELLLSRGAERNFKSKTGLLFSDLLLKHLYFAVRHNDENKVESLLRAGADQTAQLHGTGVTPQEEAKRRKYYPILKKMISYAPSKPHSKLPQKEEVVALEDIRKLFEDQEVDGESSDTSSTDSEDEVEGDDEDGEEENDEDDPNEDAYWRMHNAPIIVSAKDLFQDEEKAFWEHWTDKPISAKEIFREKAWWENSSSSSSSSASSTSCGQSSSEESGDEPIPTFEETKQKWGKVVPAKEFFREDECWWRDAVEDLDKSKVISAKEFFKDEAPWWDRNSSDDEKEFEEKQNVVENEKPIPAKEFFKDVFWWEQSSSDEEKVSSNTEDEVKIRKEKEEKSEEEEVSVYEDLEESLTDDWETANDSIMSDTSTMYSVSEGDVKIMATDLFAEKPWWEDDTKSDNSGESSSAKDELSEDQSDGSEATEIDADTEKEKNNVRRRILSSTESDASTNIILEDNADDESVGNVLDLETDDELIDSNILGVADNEWTRKNTNGTSNFDSNILGHENEAVNQGISCTSSTVKKEDSNGFVNREMAETKERISNMRIHELAIENPNTPIKHENLEIQGIDLINLQMRSTKNGESKDLIRDNELGELEITVKGWKQLNIERSENEERNKHMDDETSRTEFEDFSAVETEESERGVSDQSITDEDPESKPKYITDIMQNKSETEELLVLSKIKTSEEEIPNVGGLQTDKFNSEELNKPVISGELKVATEKENILQEGKTEAQEPNNANKDELETTTLTNLEVDERKAEEILDTLDNDHKLKADKEVLTSLKTENLNKLYNSISDQKSMAEIQSLSDSQIQNRDEICYSVANDVLEAEAQVLRIPHVGKVGNAQHSPTNKNLETEIEDLSDLQVEKLEKLCDSVIDQLLEAKTENSDILQMEGFRNEELRNPMEEDKLDSEIMDISSLQTEPLEELYESVEGEDFAVKINKQKSPKIEYESDEYGLSRTEREVQDLSYLNNNNNNNNDNSNNNIENQNANEEILPEDKYSFSPGRSSSNLSIYEPISPGEVNNLTESKLHPDDFGFKMKDYSEQSNGTEENYLKAYNSKAFKSIQSDPSNFICENVMEDRPSAKISNYHSHVNIEAPIISGVKHSQDETEIPEDIAQTLSIQLKINDIMPSNSKDLKGKNLKYADEKLVTVQKPIVNKMDACLARLDASLAWLDAKMAADTISDTERSKITEKDTFPALSDRHAFGESLRLNRQIRTKPCPEVKTTLDTFQIFRVKVRIPEQHTLKSFENYHEKGRPNSELFMKTSSSENALYDGKYNMPSKLGDCESSGMQKYKSLAKLESLFPQDKEYLHTSSHFLDNEERSGNKSTVLKPANTSSNDRFKDTKASSSRYDESKGFDLLSLLTDTIQSTPLSDQSKISTSFKLRRHNSEDLFLRKSDTQNSSLEDNYDNKSTSQEFLFQKGKFQEYGRANPLRDRRYSSGEIHDRPCNAGRNIQPLSKEELIKISRKRIGHANMSMSEKANSFTERRHSADELSNERFRSSALDPSDSGLLKNLKQNVNACSQNNIVSDFDIQKYRHVPEKSQEDTHIPRQKDQGILKPPSECETKLKNEPSNTDYDVLSSLESSDKNQTTPHEDASTGDQNEPSHSSCSSIDSKCNATSADSEMLPILDFEPVILPTKSNWRWSTFEPRSLNEYDHIVSSFMTSPKSKSLFKRSRSTNSVNDTTSVDEIGQQVGNETIISENRSSATRNLESPFSTNQCEAKSNLKIKPPIPPRRHKDNRQSTAPNEKPDDKRFCSKKIVNDRYLSHNIGQQQKNERDECIASTSKETGNISNIDTKILENNSLDEMPKNVV